MEVRGRSPRGLVRHNGLWSRCFEAGFAHVSQQYEMAPEVKEFGFLMLKTVNSQRMNELRLDLVI